MTATEASSLYMWMMATWPTVIKPGASEQFQNAKIQELIRTYRNYDTELVLEAYEKWARENDKYPTTKQILNEVKWLKMRNRVGDRENEATYMLEMIDSHGNESVYEHDGKIAFIRAEFVDLPANPDHLQPEEWEKRYQAVRRRVLKKVYAESLPKLQAR